MQMLPIAPLFLLSVASKMVKGTSLQSFVSETFRDHPETRGQTEGESGSFGVSRPLLDEMGVKKETITPGDGMLILLYEGHILRVHTNTVRSDYISLDALIVWP